MPCWTNAASRARRHGNTTPAGAAPSCYNHRVAPDDRSTVPSTVVDRLFVYGTLRRGQANDILALQPAPTWVGRASVHGTLYDLGRYPGVVLGGTALVRGEVYEIAPALEEKLDEIEMIYPQQRDEYFKRELSVAVALDNGLVRWLNCLCYVYNPAYLGSAPVIASGDWVEAERLRSPNSPRNDRP